MYGYIYRITDLTNGKCYIGQHKYDKPELDPKYHGSSRIIKNQIRKHPENFLEEIIFIAATLEEANYFETYFIEHLNTLYPNGYNLNTGGDKSVLCEISREKISKTLKGRKLPEETRQKLKGRTAWNKGIQTHSIPPNAFEKGHQPWNKGKIMDEEFCKTLTKYYISKEELYDLYVVQGLSTFKIAKMYGCDPTTIQKKLKKFNISKIKGLA